MHTYASTADLGLGALEYLLVHLCNVKVVCEVTWVVCVCDMGGMCDEHYNVVLCKHTLFVFVPTYINHTHIIHTHIIHTHTIPTHPHTHPNVPFESISLVYP